MSALPLRIDPDFDAETKPAKLATVAKALRGMASVCPSLFIGLNPSAPSSALAPLLIRMENAGLIEFDERSASPAEFAKFHSFELIDLIETALKKKLSETPDWTFFPEKSEPIDPSTLEWGAPPKEKVVGDSPPEDDPRFGTW